jgi:hypothetical protein
MKDALTASPLPTCCDSPRPLSCWSLEDGRVGEPCDGVVGGLDDLIDVDVEGLHPGRAQPTRIRSFEHKRGRKDLGAKLGANDRNLQATSGHNQITSVQLDDSLSDTRRHTATLRRCLLSSGSRVRILPGALLSFPRSTGYEPSQPHPGDPHATVRPTDWFVSAGQMDFSQSPRPPATWAAGRPSTCL